MSHSHQPFESTFRVTPDDIDQLGHVNNVNYLRWVQEVAIVHWRFLAPPQEQDCVVWVVLRHEIDYKKPALAGDEIIAKTWVGTSSKLSFERYTEILRAKDRQVLAKARTLWCPIDAQTGRPTQVSQVVRELFSVPAEPIDPK